MLATFLSTIGLYNRAKSVGGLASTISNLISHLMSHSDHRIRQLLESLGRRVDCIMGPLNFCLLWSNDKGTAVSDIVYQARDTLVRIERFIHACLLPSSALASGTLLTAAEGAGGLPGLLIAAGAAGNNGIGPTGGANGSLSGTASVLSTPSKRSKEEIELIATTLKTYLKELEFAITSVNLAVSVINASHTYQPMASLPSLAAPLSAPIPVSVPWFNTPSQQPRPTGPALQPSAPATSTRAGVLPSLSALLRASDRLRGVHDSDLGGDVTFSFGTLYAYHAPPPHIAFIGIVPPPAGSSPAPLTPPTTNHSSHSEGVSSTHRAAAAASDEKSRRKGGSGSVVAHPSVSVTATGEEDDGLLSIEGGVQQIALDASVVSVSSHSNSSFIDEQYMNRHSSTASNANARQTGTTNGSSSSGGRSKFDRKSDSKPHPNTGGGAGTAGWQLISRSAAMKIVRNSSRRVYELHCDDMSTGSMDDPSLSDEKSAAGVDPRHLRTDLDFGTGFRNITSHALYLDPGNTGIVGGVNANSASGGLSGVAGAGATAGGATAAAGSGGTGNGTAGGGGGGGGSTIPTNAVIESGFTWVSLFAGHINTRYAFILHDVSEQTSIRARKDNLRPIEIMYLARLCAYENAFAPFSGSGAVPLQPPPPSPPAGVSSPIGVDSSAASAVPVTSTLAHLTASDEELWILFGDLPYPGANAFGAQREREAAAAAVAATANNKPPAQTQTGITPNSSERIDFSSSGNSAYTLAATASGVGGGSGGSKQTPSSYSVAPSDSNGHTTSNSKSKSKSTMNGGGGSGSSGNGSSAYVQPTTNNFLISPTAAAAAAKAASTVTTGVSKPVPGVATAAPAAPAPVTLGRKKQSTSTVSTTAPVVSATPTPAVKQSAVASQLQWSTKHTATKAPTLNSTGGAGGGTAAAATGSLAASVTSIGPAPPPQSQQSPKLAPIASASANVSGGVSRTAAAAAAEDDDFGFTTVKSSSKSSKHKHHSQSQRSAAVAPVPVQPPPAPAAPAPAAAVFIDPIQAAVVELPPEDEGGLPVTLSVGEPIPDMDSVQVDDDTF